MQEEKEIWRDIPGYEGYYQVSNLGRVRSLDRVVIRSNGVSQTWKGKVLKPKAYRNGYLFVCLTSPQKKNYAMIHRLVAKAFIPNPNNLPQVNHKSEDKTENFVENLEWCDALYNINYGNRTSKQQLSQVKRVYQFTLDGVLVKSFPSVKDATLETGIDNISGACLGKYSNAGGYIWSYQSCCSKYTPRQTSRRIVCMKQGDSVMEYSSLRDAERKTGIPRREIAKDCRNNKVKFRFKYA